MSAASRLAAADGQIIKKPVFDLWSNPAKIPGSFSASAVDHPLHAGGLEWLPSHAEPWACSIGYALAVELTRPRVDLVKASAS